MIFLDTCILIDYSKDKITIKDEDKQNYCFSSIVQLEFTAGALNKRELKKINRILSEFKSIDTDQDILDLAIERDIITEQERDEIWEDNVIQWLCGNDQVAKDNLVKRILG